MKTFGPALIILSAGLGLSLASPQFGLGDDPCQYRCTDGGGCEVRYIGPPRSGKIKGSCFPNSFGGSCSGTPRECQHCNQAISCQEEEEDFPRTQTGTRTPTRTRTPPRSRPVQPREPKSIGQSSLFEVVAGGTCVTICDNWPFAQCKVGLQRTNGGHQAATCINPYTGSTNRFNNQPQKFSNYPECASIPTGCQRCDETCSLRDGKSSRNDY